MVLVSELMRASHTWSYPYNALRNQAIARTRTKLLVLLDVDFLLRRGCAALCALGGRGEQTPADCMWAMGRRAGTKGSGAAFCRASMVAFYCVYCVTIACLPALPPLLQAAGPPDGALQLRGVAARHLHAQGRGGAAGL